MTDDERQKLCTELRTSDELAFYWRKLAADEIERLVKEAVRDYELYKAEVEAMTVELKQLNAERNAAQSTLAAVRERLELRVSELERKQTW